MTRRARGVFAYMRDGATAAHVCARFRLTPAELRKELDVIAEWVRKGRERCDLIRESNIISVRQKSRRG